VNRPIRLLLCTPGELSENARHERVFLCEGPYVEAGQLMEVGAFSPGGR